MQTHRYITGAHHLAWMAAASLLCFSSGYAQTTAPQTAAEKAAREKAEKQNAAEVPVVLSPFVVDSSKDEGYRATSTLAGSRINTELKDVAASITVVTKEFMKDVAAVDINDILTYTANTEGTGDFTATADSLGRPSDDVAASPNTANRVRGLRSADITRDYFFTISRDLGFDTYNLDQVTISRGPNSILAGLGSAAGIINYSPQYAQLSRNRTEVSYRYGSFDDQRATVNTNLVAKKDMLAFRFAGVWADRGYQQQPAWNEDQRVYFTATYKPWRKTTIRAGYEKVKIDSRTPNSLTPEDGVTQWVELGRPTYDSASTEAVSPFIPLSGTNMPTFVINSSGVLENAYNENTRRVFTQRNMALLPIFTRQRLYDNRYFDLHEVNLSPSTQKRNLTVKSVSLDQEILPGLNANASYVREVGDHEFMNLFRTEYNVYSIDVNRNLPNGQPNPHFLETYMQFRGLDNLSQNHDTNEVVRGTVSYDLDLRKHHKWLGRYRATVFGEKRETEKENWQYNAKVAGDLGPESIGYRYYLGGSDTRRLASVPQTPALFTAPEIAVTPTGIVNRTLTSFYGLKSNRRDLQKLTTRALIIQGYFLDDRIVATYGTRRDKEETAGKVAVGGTGGIVPPATPGYPPLSSYSDGTTSYGVVARPLKWLSFHYNRSENFIPIAGAVDLQGNPTPSPAGAGKDYGVSVSLFENKLNLKLNWFEITEANGTAANANFPLAQWEIPYMEQTYMPDLARQGGITYKSGMAPGLITGDSRLANAYTSDNTAEGLEVELTYNVTRNWRIMAQVSKQEAKQANIAPDLTAYIEERLAYWRSVPALWTQYTAQNVGWGGGQTGEQYWNGGNRASYLRYKSADGKPSTQLAKWHGSIVTNYTFEHSGLLKGFSIGGAARYIEKPLLGNPAIVDPATGLVTGLDLTRPYYGHTRISLDAWVGYRRKIFSDRYDLTVQLNGRDLEEKGSLRPVGANSDGGHPTYRIVNPRTFYLTTTIGF